MSAVAVYHFYVIEQDHLTRLLVDKYAELVLQYVTLGPVCVCVCVRYHYSVSVLTTKQLDCVSLA